VNGLKDLITIQDDHLPFKENLPSKVYLFWRWIQNQPKNWEDKTLWRNFLFLWT